MKQKFTPYANEEQVIRVGGIEIENRMDRISINGDLIITKDTAGLALARELQAIINSVVNTLQIEKHLPDTIQIQPSGITENPFS